MLTEKIALLVDSASDVPSAVLNQYSNIAVAPMQVIINGQAYQDRQTITPDEFYQQQATATTLPTTSSPVIGKVMTLVEDLQKRGFTHVIGLTISGALSVTNSVFQQVAAEQTDLKMAVINTKNIGVGSGLFALYAEDLINAGESFDNIVNALNAAVPESHVYFYLPTLKYLRAGGRIGKVAGLLGSALNIKPVITCDSDGIYTTIAQARTEKKAIRKMVDLALKDIAAHPNANVAVAHGMNPELMDTVCSLLREQIPTLKIDHEDISPALGVHTGPGLVGIAVQSGA